MNYCVVETASGQHFDFDFKPVDETKKAVFRSKEDAWYFLDCSIRDRLGSDAIDSERKKYSVKETA
ncbi:MAG TPA: hypothetical protein DEO40_01310 [Treponema sp.]|jgi:hypothetical protein|nr:hypothetical protein [Treponema sp.]HAK68841.1 hypothetical protein [Treponema sp.]HBB42231.1 hypothetical protein [Treponema sp.]HCA19296.1 hypothetical protein [Treponema sp.]